MRRVKRIRITNELFISWIRGGFLNRPFSVTGGLPEDAILVGIHLDERMACIEALFESSVFDSVEEGDTPPELYPSYSEAAG